MFIVSNHTLNNGNERSLSFNCMPPPSFSSFLSIQCNGFFSLFSCLCSFFCVSFSVSRISSFLSHNNFIVHPLMLLLHPLTSHSPLLWVFFLPPSHFLLLWMSSSETCLRLIDSTSPEYKHSLTHLCQSLFFHVLSSSLCPSHFLGSLLSLTSPFFIQVQLVLSGLLLDLWQGALW